MAARMADNYDARCSLIVYLLLVGSGKMFSLAARAISRARWLPHRKIQPYKKEQSDERKKSLKESIAHDS